MVQPFVRKLRHGSRLMQEDVEVLSNLAQLVRRILRGGDLVAEGMEPRFLPLIIDGWACRHRLLENGKRQIIGIFVPGDLCEPFGVLPRFMHHSLSALTPVVFSPVSAHAIRTAARANARIEEALWWDLLVASAIERERVVSLGRRSASERMGHLFCELHLRLEMVGLVDGLGYDMPATQADLGDLLGLSTVHVNRSLQELRKSGLVSLRERRLTIHDLEGLRELSFFDEGYLQSSGLAANRRGE